MRRLQARHESFPLRGTFRISRGAKRSSEVVTVSIGEDDAVGRGEGTPYARYGESLESVLAEIEAARAAVEAGIGRRDLLQQMKPGAARNAVDCALWDLEAKRAGCRAWDLAGLAAPIGLVTAYSLSLDTPERMAEAAAEKADWPLLKLKLAGEGDIERVRAVRAAAPAARLIVDANEGWRPEQFAPLAQALAGLGVALIEQPLPAGEDAALASLAHPIKVCADEACHVAEDVPGLVGRYDAVNVKLDKAGGLTAALALVAAAEAAGLGLMVGCMVSSSLAMAPAMLVASRAEFVDLDGPLLLARDREAPIRIERGRMLPPEAGLWG
jgi:L-alanine-DL-glutamate epimerase-like enolase superfamily enzyme